MSKNQRETRLEVILEILRAATEALSLTEIYEKMKDISSLDISRKTIERDIHEMIKKGIILQCSLNPIKVSPWGQFGAVMHLSHEEITYLIVVLPESHPLSKRLRKLIGIEDGEKVFEEV